MSGDQALYLLPSLTREAEAETFYCPACGRIFGKLSAYNSHVGSCRKRKKRMASALELAQETYRRKKLCLNDPPFQPQLVLQPESSFNEAAGPSQEEVSSYHSNAHVFARLSLIHIRWPPPYLQLGLRMPTATVPPLWRNGALGDKTVGSPSAIEMNSQPLLHLYLLLFQQYRKITNQPHVPPESF